MILPFVEHDSTTKTSLFQQASFQKSTGRSDIRELQSQASVKGKGYLSHSVKFQFSDFIPTNKKLALAMVR